MNKENFNLVCGSCASFSKASCPPRCTKNFYSHVLGDTLACVMFQRVVDVCDRQPKKQNLAFRRIRCLTVSGGFFRSV